MENLCKWVDEPLTPRDFIAKYQLPTVVRLLSNGGGSPREVSTLGPCADRRKPFLFYSKRRRTKAFGYNQIWDETSKSHADQGPLLEIPKDYAGWFEIVQKRPNLKEVNYYQSISQVASSGYTRFLVRTLTGGFRTRDDPAGLTLLEDHMVYPGEVLDVLSTVTKEWKADEIESRQKAQPRTEYLKCSDYDGHEICIPMVHPGIFSPVSERGDKNPKVVWHITDILDLQLLPITLKLVFGWPPKLPNDIQFSGIITVVEKRRPESIIMYNFQDRSTVVMEIPLDMNMRIQAADDQRNLKRSKAYAAAVKRCQASMCYYLINMKVLDLNYDSVPRPDGGKRSFYPYSLMPQAVDMVNFSPRDIYPPVKEDRPEKVGLLTFKDPVGLLDVRGNLEGVPIPLKPSHPILRARMSKSFSADFEDMPEGSPPIPPPRSRMRDARKSRMEEADSREAKC